MSDSINNCLIGGMYFVVCYDSFFNYGIDEVGVDVMI